MNALTSPRLWKNVKNKISTLFQSHELMQIARKVKFIQRNTSLLQAKDFIELMTVASLDSRTMSLERLCSTLRTLNSEADLTPQSLMERVNRPASRNFLKLIFENVLKKTVIDIVERVPPTLLSEFANVYLEDCTECALNEELQDAFKGSSGGASASSVKIDFIYEVTRKNIFSIELTDRRNPDQKLAKNHLNMIQAGDLWIRDLGFFCAKVFKTIIATGAYFLSRLPASANVYLNEQDSETIDLAKHINHHYPNDSVIELQAFVTVERIPCRLIVYRAPREVAEKRRRVANAEAKKKGRTKKEANINRLDFTFFITNVPRDIWKSEVVGTIYAVRWQIELIFKNWKSSLQIHYLKGTDADRIKCLLYGKLIITVLMHMIYRIADWYAQKIGREISLHKVVNWLKVDNKIALIVFKGFSWALFTTLEREIVKTMCKNKRKRKTTESAIKEEVEYCEFYANLHGNLAGEVVGNQEVKVA